MKMLSFMVCFVAGTIASFGQTTPNCSDISIYVVYPPPLTQAQINSINAEQQSQFPNVVKLEEPTSSYNCHNYAFVKSEEGPEFWLNTPGDDAFWEDGSYVVTTNTSQANLKVSYQGDHSAVTTSTSNQAISKWGPWGLYRHNITDVPSSYLPNSTLTYYKRNLPLVTGPSLVCTSNTTFTLQNRPAGTTVTWTRSSNLTQVSGQGTNNYVVKAVNSTTTGTGWVRATINGSCGQAVLPQRNVWVGKFTGGLSFSGGPGVCNNSTVTYTVNVPFGHKSNYTYSWSYPSGWTKLNSFDNKITLRPPSSSSGGGVLNVTVNNGCGTASGGLTIYSYPCGGYYMVYPNPTSNYLNVGLSETENSSSSDLLMNDLQDSTVKVKKEAVKYQIIDKEGVVYEKGTFELPFELDLSGLPSGNYMLIIEGKEIQEYKHFIKE